ncbi:MAG TPA: endolytic transglycosylase MltG [Candidatus Binataceae bacterium]|nr:endolytic transglycosylase MltG [Candidatus Binataceae bacterium]
MKWGIIAILVVLLSGACAFGVWFAFFRPVARFTAPRIVTIDRGDSFRTAARKLERAGVVRSSIVLIIWADFSGQARSVKPGDYEFAGGESIGAVLHHLVRGDYLVSIVTIPEGLTVRQIGERLERAGLVCQSDFDFQARQGPLIAALGLEPLGAEGYLFPATYRFSPHADAEAIVAQMLQRFYALLTPTVEQRMFELHVDTRQLVTMASIVEKEARVPGERALVASVFYNRLRLGMPLQSDPTAEYNPEGEDEPAVIAVHRSSQFNTYEFVGLPPGPIANPGESSIMAALYPAHTDYLYFVARGDGTHVFSRTLKEQERAIAALRKHEAQPPAAAALPLETHAK